MRDVYDAHGLVVMFVTAIAGRVIPMGIFLPMRSRHGFDGKDG